MHKPFHCSADQGEPTASIIENHGLLLGNIRGLHYANIVLSYQDDKTGRRQRLDGCLN